MFRLEEQLQNQHFRILFTEGRDPRMMEAAILLHQQTQLQPILYGDTSQLKQSAAYHHYDLTGIQILDPAQFPFQAAMLKRIIEIRKGKTDIETAKQWLAMDSYFCTMYVEMGYADGLLGGSIQTTAQTLRPIMQLVKTSYGHSIISSCFLMKRQEEYYIFADCSLNIDPNVDDLVEIALQSAESAKSFGLQPHVALLSYSTKGSGKGRDVDKVREAAIRLKRLPLDYDVDGELQADCALNAHVASLKAKDSKVGGVANVLIFPDLNAGNIGYKLVAHLGHFEAYGPILQGVRLPMNDLSRSASVHEIYQMALITALQKLYMQNKEHQSS